MGKRLKKSRLCFNPYNTSELIKIIEDYRLYEFDKVKAKGFNYEKPKREKAKTKTLDTTYYKVKKGDTLYSIARKFNISVSKLKQVNNLKNNTISIDQVLKTN